MYETILIQYFFNLILSGSAVILFTYYGLTKFISYKLNQEFYFYLKFLRKNLSNNSKILLKKYIKDKDKNKNNFLITSFIFLGCLVLLFLLVLILKYLNNPIIFKKSIINYYKNIYYYFGYMIFMIIFNLIITILMNNFMTIPFNILQIKKKINVFLLKHIHTLL